MRSGRSPSTRGCGRFVSRGRRSRPARQLSPPYAILGLAVLALFTPSFARAAEDETTVVCRDGATSKGGRGACRGHGGVDKAATAKGAGGAAAAAATARTPATPAEPAAPPPAVSPPAKAGATAATSTAAAAQRVPRQADDKKGPPSARCKDGTLSYAQHHTGACSRHGGVEEWLDKK